MSFILDALKKSETERQQQAAAEFSAVPSAPQRSETPRWIWLLGGLLLVNLAVLSVALLKGDPSTPVTSEIAAERAPGPTRAAELDQAPAAATTAPSRSESRGPQAPADSNEGFSEPAAAQTPADSNGGFAARLSETPAPPRRRTEPTTVPTTTPTRIETPPPERAAARTAPGPDSAFEALPTLTEIRLNDGVNLPDMSLDIHVFASAPENRFVFIDMQKHQEGSVLDSGPRLIEITNSGVILDYRGTRFILPRE